MNLATETLLNHIDWEELDHLTSNGDDIADVDILACVPNPKQRAWLTRQWSAIDMDAVAAEYYSDEE